jgi:hypothetical protein
MSDPKADQAFRRARESTDTRSPMTAEQADELRTLCEKADSVDVYREDLSKAEASTLIDRLKEKAGIV